MMLRVATRVTAARTSLPSFLNVLASHAPAHAPVHAHAHAHGPSTSCAVQPPGATVPRRLFFNDLFKTTTVVGRDDAGNVYHAEPFTDELTGETKEKRWVDPKGVTDPFEYDETKLPVEWLAWLRRTRGDPPTPEESRQAEAARLSLQTKVKQLRDEKRDGPPPMSVGT